VSDLVAFLRARLDDDEQVARAAGAGVWTRECGHTDFGGADLPPGHDTCCVVSGDIHLYDEGGHDGDQAEHIARWDPARVLAEVAAKRGLILLFEQQGERGTAHCHECPGPGLILGGVLQVLAAPYADHHDYRQEWTP